MITLVIFRLAQAVASAESLRQLRAAAVEKFGESAAASINGLRLEWRVMHLLAGTNAGSDRVLVVLHVPVAGDKERAAAIREFCVQALRSQLSELLAKEAGRQITLGGSGRSQRLLKDAGASGVALPEQLHEAVGM